MQMTLVALIMILVSLLPTEQKNPITGKQRKTPVELWCVGDDVFSKEMCQAFFAAFEPSPDFNLQEETSLEISSLRSRKMLGGKKWANARK
jgi:hypothetical protein